LTRARETKTHKNAKSKQRRAGRQHGIGNFESPRGGGAGSYGPNLNPHSISGHRYKWNKRHGKRNQQFKQRQQFIGHHFGQ
jgi:hypothetical protein